MEIHSKQVRPLHTLTNFCANPTHHTSFSHHSPYAPVLLVPSAPSEQKQYALTCSILHAYTWCQSCPLYPIVPNIHNILITYMYFFGECHANMHAFLFVTYFLPHVSLRRPQPAGTKPKATATFHRTHRPNSKHLQVCLAGEPMENFTIDVGRSCTTWHRQCCTYFRSGVLFKTYPNFRHHLDHTCFTCYAHYIITNTCLAPTILTSHTYYP